MFEKRRTFREFLPWFAMSTPVFLFSVSAWAGTYTLVTGAHEEVCQAYKRNFEPRHDSEPMACERRFNRDIPGFSSVQWTRLNLSDHFDLYKKARIYLLRNNNSSQGMKLSDVEIIQATENLRPSAATWHVQLYLARLDLAGDGHLLNVLMVQRGGCGPDAKPTDAATISDLFFLNDSLTDIDYPRQDNMNGWFEHATIEDYKGRPYIEVYVADGGWLHLLTGNGMLHVLQYARARQIAAKFPQAEVRGDGPIAECELKYSQGSTEIR